MHWEQWSCLCWEVVRTNFFRGGGSSKMVLHIKLNRWCTETISQHSLVFPWHEGNYSWSNYNYNKFLYWYCLCSTCTLMKLNFMQCSYLINKNFLPQNWNILSTCIVQLCKEDNCILLIQAKFAWIFQVWNRNGGQSCSNKWSRPSVAARPVVFLFFFDSKLYTPAESCTHLLLA